MKKNIPQTLLLAVALMSSFTLMAQADVTITLNNGNTTAYRVEASGRLYFDNDNLMVVTEQSAAPAPIALESIRSMHFDAPHNNDILAAETTSFTLSPNPTSGKVTIAGLNNGTQDVSVFAIDGTTVFTGKIANGHTMDLSALPAGMYFVKVGNHCEKLIKQ